MKNSTKNLLIVLLSLVTVLAAALGIRAILTAQPKETVNRNVTRITAPDQTDFEVHPEWIPPTVEVIDYGENLALGKPTKENGHTQVYQCRNTTDGDRFTYWEGKADSFPNEVTVDLEASHSLTGARVLLNPRALWGARTQEIEVQVSTDGENFTTVFDRTVVSFDPNEDNSAYLPFSAPTEGQYVRFVFYSNTGATGGQAAELEVYG